MPREIRGTCSECGRKLDGLMATHEDVDVLDRLRTEPWLLAIVGVLIVLLVVCGEAVLR